MALKVTPSKNTINYWGPHYKESLELIKKNVIQYINHNYASNTNHICINNEFMHMKDVLDIKKLTEHRVPALNGQHGAFNGEFTMKKATILGCLPGKYYSKSAWKKYYNSGKSGIHKWYNVNHWPLKNNNGKKFVIIPYDLK